jgi:hypothetical protein
MASASVALISAVGACDPGEDPGVWTSGPTFLVLGQAKNQPPSAQDGTSIFVQARGGSFVSITTYGCQHRYAALTQDANSSCAELPGSEPLYFLVKPSDRDCVVEARLYGDCDPSADAAASYGVCGPHDAFVASAVLAVRPRVASRDGGPVDARREADR